MKESKMKPELPIDRDKMLSLFEYRDGMIFWKKSPTFSVKAGDRAGYFCPRNRYRTVRVGFILYKEHRIIWTMLNGLIPSGIQIDHINGIHEAASAYKIAAKTIHKEFAKIDIAI